MRLHLNLRQGFVGVSSSQSEIAQPDLLSTPQAGPAAVRGGALRVISYAGASLIALASGAVLYRYLGVVKSGHYNAAGNLVALVAAGSDLGLTAIGIRELSVRTGEARERIMSTLLGVRLVLAAAGVLAATTFALIAYGPTLGLGVLLAGTGLVFAIWQGTLAIPLMVDMRLGWTSLFEFLRQLLLSILIVVFVLADAGLLAFLASPIPASAAVLVLTMVLFRRKIPTRIGFDRADLRALITPVLSYAAAVAAAALYFRVAILLVSLLSSGFQLGYFSLSFNIMAALFALPALLITVAFPIFSRAARDDHARLAYAIERVFEVSLIVGAWMSLAIALSAQFAVELIGGPKFAPAADVLAIQGISVGAAFVGAVWGFGLLSLERYRVILLFNLFALAAVVVAVSILASADGAEGAAIGTSAVEVANAIIGLSLLTYGRAHLRPSLRVLPKVAIALAIAATPILLPISEPVRVVLSGGIYLVALLIMRALPAELVELLPSHRLRRPR
jgi:O-antigen/teichoic acid export membrane protein